MNYDRSSNLSLKYHRFTTSGCKDEGIYKDSRLYEVFGISPRPMVAGGVVCEHDVNVVY